MIWVSCGHGGWALGIPFFFSLVLAADDRIGFLPRDPGAVPLAGLIYFGGKWRRRDADLKVEFRAAVKQWDHRIV